MASNEHSSLDNSQLHVPKDFSTASANTVLTKNGSNALTWADDNLRRAHFVRVGGHLNKSTTDEYAPSYASGTQHSFDTVVSFSSGTTLSDAQEAVAHSQLYCLRNGYINSFGGVVAITNTKLGDTVTETGEGNTTPNVFSTGSLSSSSSFSAGDIIIVTLQPTAASSTVVRFNSTMEIVYTED